MEQTIQRLEQETGRGKGGKKLSRLSSRVKQLKQSNRTLRKQLENHDLLAKQKYGSLEQEVKNLQKEVQVYRKREKEVHQNPMYLMPYMKQYMTDEHLPDLIELLESFITKDNLHYFYRGQHNLFYLLMRRVNLLRYHSKTRKTPYRLKNTKNISDKERLGYLTYENDVWMFVDASQSDYSKTYHVIENRSKEALTVDQPVRAILWDEGVVVDKYLSLDLPVPVHNVNKQQPFVSALKQDSKDLITTCAYLTLKRCELI